jgi:hypothetical protein
MSNGLNSATEQGRWNFDYCIKAGFLPRPKAAIVLRISTALEKPYIRSYENCGRLIDSFVRGFWNRQASDQDSSIWRTITQDVAIDFYL